VHYVRLKCIKLLFFLETAAPIPSGRNAYSKTRLGVLWLEASNPFYQTLLTLRVFLVVKRPSE
jgi:hypothetical protein